MEEDKQISLYASDLDQLENSFAKKFSTKTVADTVHRLLEEYSRLELEKREYQNLSDRLAKVEEQLKAEKCRFIKKTPTDVLDVYGIKKSKDLDQMILACQKEIAQAKKEGNQVKAVLLADELASLVDQRGQADD